MPLVNRSAISEELIRKIIQEELSQSKFKGNSNKGKIVFVSHSFAVGDMKKSLTLQKVLTQYSINSYLAEKDPQYGYILSNKIREAIQKSVAFVVILTKNSINSASVNQEIGYALGLGMTIIPMVSYDVKGEVGVLLNDVEGEIFNETDFENKCDKIAKFISEQIKNLQLSTSENKFFSEERGNF